MSLSPVCVVMQHVQDEFKFIYLDTHNDYTDDEINELLEAEGLDNA